MDLIQSDFNELNKIVMEDGTSPVMVENEINNYQFGTSQGR